MFTGKVSTKIDSESKHMPLKPIKTKDRLDVIKKDPQSAYLYSKKILNGRWTEAEPYIMQDPFYAYVYAKHVLKQRWPEAEPYIMKNPTWAYQYALYVIKDKWPEAEPTIKKDKHYNNIYKKAFNH